MFGRSFRQLCKDLELQIENLRDGLDHEVDISQVIEFGRSLQTPAHGIRVALADPLLAHVFAQKLIGEGKTFVECGLGGVDEDDRDTGLTRGDEGDPETLS
jgi:hypothetical protein